MIQPRIASPRPLPLLIAAVAMLATLIGVTSLPAATARATSADIISTTVTPASATVGDRITLTIVIEHDNAITIDAPGFGADFGGLEPTAVAPPSADQHGSRTRTTLGYTLVAFKPGDYNLGALTTLLDQVIAWSAALSPLRAVPQPA